MVQDSERPFCYGRSGDVVMLVVAVSYGFVEVACDAHVVVSYGFTEVQ